MGMGTAWARARAQPRHGHRHGLGMGTSKGGTGHRIGHGLGTDWARTGHRIGHGLGTGTGGLGTTRVGWAWERGTARVDWAQTRHGRIMSECHGYPLIFKSMETTSQFCYLKILIFQFFVSFFVFFLQWQLVLGSTYGTTILQIFYKMKHVLNPFFNFVSSVFKVFLKW